MLYDIDLRVRAIAEFVLENRVTVREAARQFNVSKSTVHKDLTARLPALEPDLSDRVRSLLNLHKAERHLRGGLATSEKYRRKREAKASTDAKRAAGM